MLSDPATREFDQFLDLRRIQQVSWCSASPDEMRPECRERLATNLNGGNPGMAETREIPYAGIGLATVRSYVNGRADQSSVREVARKIGIVHTSLEKFLAGAHPYAKNRIKIIEYYLREHDVHPVPERLNAGAPVRTAERAEEHVEALLAELRGEARTEARLKITTAIAQAYRRMGVPEPGWLFASR